MQNLLIIDYEIEGDSSAERLFNHIENLMLDTAESQLSIEVVVYGKAIYITTEKSTHEAAITELHANGVIFSVCQNAMNTFGLEATSLNPAVQIVPAGIGRIAKAQLEGAIYYKAL